MTEVGAGDGTLARQLVEPLGHLDLAYTAVDRSDGARTALASIDGISVAERIGGSPDVIVANELLDNLPFRRLRGTDAGTKEVVVGLDADRLVESLRDPPSGHAELAVGAESILPEGATAFVEELAARLARPGYALLIDYGGLGGTGGPAHGYRAHRPVEDLLERPGETDITSGVDVAAIGAIAEGLGLVAFPSVTQRHALTALGFDRWIHEQLRRQHELSTGGKAWTRSAPGAGAAGPPSWSTRRRSAACAGSSSRRRAWTPPAGSTPHPASRPVERATSRYRSHRSRRRGPASPRWPPPRSRSAGTRTRCGRRTATAPSWRTAAVRPR